MVAQGQGGRAARWMAGGCSVVSQRLADCANPVGEEQSVRRSATLCLTRARGSADSDNGIGHVAGLRAAVPHMPTLADQRRLVTHDGFAARPFAGRCWPHALSAAIHHGGRLPLLLYEKRPPCAWPASVSASASRPTRPRAASLQPCALALATSLSEENPSLAA